MWTSKRRAEIHIRQTGLLLRSHDLRQRLGHQAQVLERPLALADHARGGLQWLWAHPQWIAASLVAAVALRPRRALAWGLKLWGGWRLWRQLRTLLPR